MGSHDSSTVKTIELTAEEIEILVHMIESAPLQGNIQSLVPFIEKLANIREKLNG